MRLTESALGLYRQRAGLTATQAAKALGCHPMTLGGWERGAHAVPEERIAVLAGLYAATEEQIRDAARKDGLRFAAKLSRQRRSRRTA